MISRVNGVVVYCKVCTQLFCSLLYCRSNVSREVYGYPEGSTVVEESDLNLNITEVGIHGGVQYCTVHCTLLYISVPYSSLLYRTVLLKTVENCTVESCTILYRSLQH